MQNNKYVNWLGTMFTVAVLATFIGCQTKSHEGEKARKVDDAITKEIKSELSKEPVYKFTGVEVRTYEAVVQLSGFVDSEQQKVRAGEIAQHTPGAVRIVNAIAVKSPALTPTGWTNAPPIEGQPANPPTR